MTGTLTADIIHLVHSGQTPNCPLPEGIIFEQIPPISVGQWRAFYRDIGGDYLWWEKNLWSDAQLQDYINDKKHYFTIRDNLNRLGLAEIDVSGGQTIDLSYFGLYKIGQGRGLGLGFLCAVLHEIYAHKPHIITLNTCLLDHPNALKTYIKGGFVLHHLQPRQINDPRDDIILPKNTPLPPHYPYK